jgi:uncharacterized protein YjiS (DUF1127 family)
MRDLVLTIRSPVDVARRPTTLARVSVLTRLLQRVALWMEVRRERRQLLAMSDYMLHDIGISRADAEGEGGRPFWDLPNSLT